ncbi:type II toxin-antitoxin system VapC family toxin [Hymenobacter canadensis]|uniref:Ribonuclease VapC n=1 Tax=Hymenobacter canadensis TaxID=2999067 RepID=A0ABY7LPT1_9BACT|nr:type II toxin-antitoxin system VapC family toxin [Hymenobacter canadensis]WBA42418.1 type II toxin-antitoxin system VapC family toxin [Hymenobacter canadensis]
MGQALARNPKRMGAGYIADTNVVIDLVLGRLPMSSATWLDTQLAAQQIAVSVITRIELLGKLVPDSEASFLQSFVQAVAILPIDEPVVQQTILLRQQHRIKLPDALIAATAIAHGLPLLTRNVSDFNSIIGIQVLNPHEAAQLPPL